MRERYSCELRAGGERGRSSIAERAKVALVFAQDSSFQNDDSDDNSECEEEETLTRVQRTSRERFQDAVHQVIANWRTKQAERVTVLLVARRAKKRFMTLFQALESREEQDFLSGVFKSLPIMLQETAWMQYMHNSLIRTMDPTLVMDFICQSFFKLKSVTARCCWAEHVRPLREQQQRLEQQHSCLKAQFQRVREEYLQEVVVLREELRKRRDPEKEAADGDLVYFYDPVSSLTEGELMFASKVIREKLKMILQQSPGQAGPNMQQISSMEKQADESLIRELRATVARQEIDKLALNRKLKDLQAAAGGVDSKAASVIVALQEKIHQLRRWDEPDELQVLRRERDEACRAQKAEAAARAALEERLAGVLVRAEEAEAVIAQLREELAALRSRLEFQAAAAAAAARGPERLEQAEGASGARHAGPGRRCEQLWDQARGMLDQETRWLEVAAAAAPPLQKEQASQTEAAVELAATNVQVVSDLDGDMERRSRPWTQFADLERDLEGASLAGEELTASVTEISLGTAGWLQEAPEPASFTKDRSLSDSEVEDNMALTLQLSKVVGELQTQVLVTAATLKASEAVNRDPILKAEVARLEACGNADVLRELKESLGGEGACGRPRKREVSVARRARQERHEVRSQERWSGTVRLAKDQGSTVAALPLIVGLGAGLQRAACARPGAEEAAGRGGGAGREAAAVARPQAPGGPPPGGGRGGAAPRGGRVLWQAAAAPPPPSPPSSLRPGGPGLASAPAAGGGGAAAEEGGPRGPAAGLLPRQREPVPGAAGRAPWLAGPPSGEESWPGAGERPREGGDEGTPPRASERQGRGEGGAAARAEWRGKGEDGGPLPRASTGEGLGKLGSRRTGEEEGGQWAAAARRPEEERASRPRASGSASEEDEEGRPPAMGQARSSGSSSAALGVAVACAAGEESVAKRKAGSFAAFGVAVACAGGEILAKRNSGSRLASPREPLPSVRLRQLSVLRASTMEVLGEGQDEPPLPRSPVAAVVPAQSFRRRAGMIIGLVPKEVP